MASSSRSNALYLVSAGFNCFEQKASGCQCPQIYYSSDGPMAVDNSSTVILVVAACCGWTVNVVDGNAFLAAVKLSYISPVQANYLLSARC